MTATSKTHMKQYKVLPQETTALQYNGDNVMEVRESGVLTISWDPTTKNLAVATEEGAVIIAPGDYLVEIRPGKFYSWGRSDFQAAHEVPQEELITPTADLVGEPIEG